MTDMSELVSTFLPVTLRGAAEYLFFIVTWNDYVTGVSKELDEQGKHFGSDLGPKGSVIQAYAQYAKTTFSEVQAKAWPAYIQERFGREQDPFMLVTRKGFADFDPASDDWAIIWFSTFYDKPGDIYRVFGSLARKVERGEDVFGYAKSLARKDSLNKLSKYFELKTPEVFGIALDVKAIIEDIAGVNNL
jgi:hypothetical protein